MSEEIKVDKNYMEAFNLGYELAKELNLKSPMFKDVNSGNDRNTAMQAGMEQYGKEISLQINKENTQGLDRNKQKFIGADSRKNKGNENKGLDFSI